MNGLIHRKQAIAGAVLLALVAGLAGVYAGQSGLLSTWRLPGLGLGNDDQAALWNQLEAVHSYIGGRYVEPVPDDELLRGAIQGMIEATGDDYSLFLNREEYTSMLADFDDHFGGIGVEVELRENVVTVVSPIQGTPGAAAGLRPGDQIIGVDGRSLDDMALHQAVTLIRGPAGTGVRLTIRRSEQTFDVSIVRADIPIPQMDYSMLLQNPRIGYIQLYQFNTGLSTRVREAIADLREQGMQGLILDLRRNPGGLLTEAVKVAELFVPAGPVVHIVDRKGSRETREARGPGFDLPLVVLVDNGSASASEIVAGAVRDRKAGTLVGVTTYGKGSVQSFFDLPDGAGLKLTTARYLTAGGYSIHQTGIAPDVAVPVPEGVTLPLDDPSHPQLQTALEILRKRIR